MKKNKTNYTSTTGRRKEASARIRVFSGKGETIVNEKPILEYFSEVVAGTTWNKSLKLTNLEDKHHFHIKVAGGGKSGQFKAVVHGIARALSQISLEHRSLLKKNGLLTRDSRTRERRKVGTGGKARRVKQSPKR